MMNRTIASLTLAMLLLGNSPAWAEDAKTTAAPAEKKSTEKKSSSGGSDGGIGKYPARAVSFILGAAVGIPVAIVRKTPGEVVTATKDLVGETDNPFILVPAGMVFGVPAGLLSGTLLGTFVGAKNALFSDEPFSKESFSLDDLD
jgi:hypothetical protein